VSSHAATPSPAASVAYRPLAVPRPGIDAALTAGLAAILAATAFAAQGGLLLGRTTKVELALLIGSGLTVAAATVAAPPRRGALCGATTAAAFLALALFTVASVAWAVQPSDAWVEANRTLTYVAVFAAVLALVRVLPDRWPAVLGGVALGAIVVSGYALATKVFPGALSPDELYARLRAPYGYWNALGLTTAMAVPPLLWLGARRQGPPLLNALAFPALGLLLVALMLSYSRGALLALAVGCALWFAVVPLRLRGAAVLGGSAAGAAFVVLWAFSQDALTQDRLPLGVRVDAGHQLGLLLVALVLGLTALGLAWGFATASRPLSAVERRRVGIGVLCAVALIPLAVGIKLTQTDRGLFGSIGHGVNQLVDPNATQPSNDPGRLTSAGSVRARYWNESLKMFRDHAWVGVGAGGYATLRPRYRNDLLDVRHAHGYVFQTLADLGILGMALSLLALVAWAVSAARATGLRRADRGRPYTPERIGLLTMVTVVVIFGVHSFVDWSWFVPGDALPALLCAAWLAGRGPLRRNAAAEERPPLRLSLDRVRVPVAAAAVVVALLAAWAAWQPLRSLNASNDGLSRLEAGDIKGARAEALAAHDRNPLALDPLTVLAIVEVRRGDKAAALRAVEQEVELQPANTEAWLRLADFQLNQAKKPKDALRSLGAALYLDPRNPSTISAYLQVKRRVTGKKAAVPPIQPGQAAPGQPTTPGAPGAAAPAQPPGTQ
jgi:tetratricopeptide (TPR) repeat protein